MRLSLALVLVVAGTAAACGEGSTAGRDGQWETYTSDIDEIVVSYPTTWRRAEIPLAGDLTGDQFEVLGLVTGEVPEAERGCSPYPWAAMRPTLCTGSPSAVAWENGEQVSYCLEGDIDFDQVTVERADGTVVDLESFASDGRRWWEGLHGDDPRVSGEAQKAQPRSPSWRQ